MASTSTSVEIFRRGTALSLSSSEIMSFQLYPNISANALTVCHLLPLLLDPSPLHPRVEHYSCCVDGGFDVGAKVRFEGCLLGSLALNSLSYEAVILTK
ncbi:hypothetical protein KC319_g44 [Hortaea werneckii]|nr:hypothetical protein KC319_g44 [Hortaea werneckii]